MKKSNYVILFFGAVAYGWLFAVLSKNNMPDFAGLITALVTTAPAAAGTLLLLKKTLQIVELTTGEIKELTATIFLCMCLGISIGFIGNNIFPLRSPQEIDYQNWRNLMNKANSSYVNDNQRKIDSLILDKLISKYTKP